MRRIAACAALLLLAAAGPARPPAPRDNPTTPAKVELGRRLFYDADLSADGSMSCATCHEQHRGFGDGNATHAGVHGDPARRNVPGLANVGWRRTLTWGDPRIRTLEAQVLVPVTGVTPVEMGMHGRETEIAARLARDACYRRQFAEAFPETGGRVDMVTVARALAAFERIFVSRNSSWDRREAPSAAATRGARQFAHDCAGCHRGPDFTDGRYHRIIAWTAADRGLGEATGRARDDGRFRTPSLRNVAVTGPWLHDGTAKTLADAIARHPGAPADTVDLTAFLDTLTDRSFLTDPRFALPAEACGAKL